MARSARGLYQLGEVWWMTYRDAIGTHRFESCKTSKKKQAEQRLIDRRKEAMVEGIVPHHRLSHWLSMISRQQPDLSTVGNSFDRYSITMTDRVRPLSEILASTRSPGLALLGTLVSRVSFNWISWPVGVVMT